MNDILVDEQEWQRIKTKLAAAEKLAYTAQGILIYRDHHTLNFQLEKADDFFRDLRSALALWDDAKGG